MRSRVESSGEGRCTGRDSPSTGYRKGAAPERVGPPHRRPRRILAPPNQKSMAIRSRLPPHVPPPSPRSMTTLRMRTDGCQPRVRRGENFHEVGSDRGASTTVAELRDRPVNGEPREHGSRGSFFSGQLWQGLTSRRRSEGGAERAARAHCFAPIAAAAEISGEILRLSPAAEPQQLTAALRSGRDRNPQAAPIAAASHISSLPPAG